MLTFIRIIKEVILEVIGVRYSRGRSLRSRDVSLCGFHAVGLALDRKPERIAMVIIIGITDTRYSMELEEPPPR